MFFFPMEHIIFKYSYVHLQSLPHFKQAVSINCCAKLFTYLTIILCFMHVYFVFCVPALFLHNHDNILYRV